MRLGLDVKDIDSAAGFLSTLGRSVEPVLRGTLNTTGSYAKGREFTPQLARLFKKSGGVSRRLVLKRAGTKRLDARLIASSSGIDVSDYASWGYTPISPTRAVVWVAGLNGHKVAAGFVNPAGVKKLPLATRSDRRTARRVYSYNRGLTPAMGPSLAYWFQSLMGDGVVGRVNEYMLAEFDRRLEAELAKGGGR